MNHQNDDLQMAWMDETLGEFYQQNHYEKSAKEIMKRVRRSEERRKNMQRISILIAGVLLLGLPFLYAENKPAKLIFVVNASHEPQKLILPDQILVNGKSYKDSVVPGMCNIVLKKAGYQPLRFDHNAVSGENIIDKTLQVKKRHLVLTATSHKNVQIRPTNGESFFTITKMTLVTPGQYEIFAKEPGYKEYRQQINIAPAEDAYELEVHLQSDNRDSSLDITFTNPQGQTVPAYRMRINDKEFEQDMLLKPGEYKVTAQFQKYATVNKTFVIGDDNRRYALNIPLNPYKEYKLRLGKKYHGMVIDNIKFPVEIFVDGEYLSQHHIVAGEGFNLIGYTFFAPRGIRSMRVKVAFYYDESLVRDQFEFRDLRKIDNDSLIEHLQALRNTSHEQVIRRVVRLLKDRKDKYKISDLSQEERIKIVNVLRSLKLNKDYSKMRKTTIKRMTQ